METAVISLREKEGRERESEKEGESLNPLSYIRTIVWEIVKECLNKTVKHEILVYRNIRHSFSLFQEKFMVKLDHK